MTKLCVVRQIKRLRNSCLISVLYLDASILTHAAHQSVSIRIIYIILLCIDRKLVVNTEYFSFSETLFLSLLLFEFLQFKMSTESSYYDNLLVIIHDSGISLWLESTLIELLKFTLSSFSCNPLLFLFQSSFQIFRELFALMTLECSRYIFILVGDHLGLECALVILLLNVLLSLLSEFFLCRRITHIF